MATGYKMRITIEKRQNKNNHFIARFRYLFTRPTISFEHYNTMQSDSKHAEKLPLLLGPTCNVFTRAVCHIRLE